MPTTRKQKSKARNSREADMLSDIQNIDIMLGSNHLAIEESEFTNSVRRPESPRYKGTKRQVHIQTPERTKLGFFSVMVGNLAELH